MKVLAIYYGDFLEIENLYSRFGKGRKKIKVVVDVENQYDHSRDTFVRLFRHAAGLLPTLSCHSCCEEWDAAPLCIREEEQVSIKRIGENADFPHLLEHLIVDLQCTLSGMKVCSGITCGWKKPEHRFDLFIECDDPRIGVFAACFGANLINNFLAGKPSENDYGLILQIARLIDRFPETKGAISELARCLNHSVDNIIRALHAMAEMNFFIDSEKSDETESEEIQ